MGGPPLRRQRAPRGAVPRPRPGPTRSSSSWPLRLSRTLRTSPASSAKGPRARLPWLQPQGRKVPALPVLGCGDPWLWPQRHAPGRRMEPWGVRLPAPRRSAPGRGQGKGRAVPQPSGIPFALGPLTHFLPWALRAAWPRAQLVPGALTPALSSPVPAHCETRGPLKASSRPQRGHRGASGPGPSRYCQAPAGGSQHVLWPVFQKGRGQ